MSQMSRDRGAGATAPDLAEATALPAPTVSKILKMLAKGGLVESRRGVNGGYVLTRRPEDISAAEIIADRKRVVSGKSVSVRVDLGGSRIIKKKKHTNS